MGGPNEVVASVDQALWNDLYSNEAFNCVAVEEDTVYDSDPCYNYTEYNIRLSMGFGRRVE